MPKSIRSYYINSPIINNSINWINKVWKYYRWELFLVISILVFVLCYFFTKQDKYNGLTYNYIIPQYKKESKRVPKKHETECRRIVESIFKTPFSSVRPNFLKNPKTGKNLELDMYNEDLKLAIEYQGAQHRIYTPFFHKSYGDYLDQVARDNYKKEKCSDYGIDLICVPDTVKYEDLGKYITSELKRLGRLN